MSSESSSVSREHDIERTKLKMDLVKHVSTLSSGAIVILATFRKSGDHTTAASTNLTDTQWLTASVVSLIACLIVSLLYIWIFGLARQWVRTEPYAWAHRTEWIIGILLTLCFITGILSLGVFVMHNLA